MPWKDSSRTFNTLFRFYFSPGDAFLAQVEARTLMSPAVCGQLRELFQLFVTAPGFLNSIAVLAPSPAFFQHLVRLGGWLGRWWELGGACGDVVLELAPHLDTAPVSTPSSTRSTTCWPR